MQPLLQQIELDFADSIYGFEAFNRYKVEEVEENSPFLHIKNIDEPNIGFVVISPFDVYADYEFQLNDRLIAELGVSHAEDVCVLSIITIKKPFEKSTINLLAPLVINVKTGVGRQAVLNGTNYLVNAPLISSTEEGGS
ncbi:flagellar assembly protein FliW [Paenibacillus sp. NPDC058071]|uniref:flagellar assembly protein FliW n=1 Tax=Paenibacillus sp. NPDC058071 TaxID=3346326 RepID=UPI0036D88FE2